MMEDQQWRTTLAERLPLLGHRNWIVVADAAYPLQTAAGIETLFAPDPMLEVVREVLNLVSAASHVRPVIYLDAELPYVSERHAAGVTTFRESLARLLPAGAAESLPHEQIIARLDDAGKTFRVLLIKTPLTIPYTSVFIQLECGYWSEEAEAELRQAVAAHARDGHQAPDIKER